MRLTWQVDPWVSVTTEVGYSYNKSWNEYCMSAQSALLAYNDFRVNLLQDSRSTRSSWYGNRVVLSRTYKRLLAQWTCRHAQSGLVRLLATPVQLMSFYSISWINFSIALRAMPCLWPCPLRDLPLRRALELSLCPFFGPGNGSPMATNVVPVLVDVVVIRFAIC